MRGAAGRQINTAACIVNTMIGINACPFIRVVYSNLIGVGISIASFALSFILISVKYRIYVVRISNVLRERIL